MNYLLLVVASLMATAVDASIGKVSAPTVQAEQPKASPPDGKTLYQKYCQLCHGENGIGYAADHANQLKNPLFLSTARRDFLWWAIEYGRPGTPMAGFGERLGGPLNDDAIAALINYVRSLAITDLDSQVVRGNARKGARVYKTACSSCHGNGGEGKTAPSLNNPYFLATASNGFVRYAIEYGRPGTAMSRFKDKLDTAAIDDVTVFIRAWARNIEDLAPQGEVVAPLSALVLNPTGNAPEFLLRDQRYVPAVQVESALRSHARMVLLDARPKSDWFKSHIPGAYPAPFYDEHDPLFKALPADTWIVAYCSCPHAASGQLVDSLRAAGFEKTAVLDEGILEWARRKYPITFGSEIAK